MTEYDENEKRRYVGGFTGSIRDGFKRDGQGYCLDENELVKQFCLFESGVMKGVIREFDGTTMTEYYGNGAPRYVGEWKGDMKNGFVGEGEGRQYDMDGKTVVYCGEWKNGERNGSEKEYDNGHVVYSGEWSYGKRCGKGTEYDNGHELYTGEWKDGKGRGKEMDENGNVVYEGEWSDGMRNGVGREVNGNEESLLCHWKDGKKDGIAVERDENGDIKKGNMYENDEMKLVVEVKEVYEMALSRRIESSMMNVIDPDSLFISDTTTGHTRGFFQLNRRLYLIEWSRDTSRDIMVDMDSKEMVAFVDGKQMDIQCTVEVIDLDTSGRRWEGGVRDGGPYGFGVIYDREGRKEFEGFVLDEMKARYGIEYYSDVDRVEYKGGFYDDKRFGKGILYDRTGAVEYEGLWNNNRPYLSQFDGRTIDNHTGLIDIPNKSFNESESFILYSFVHSLKRLVIGDDCFESVRLFELNELTELENIEIRKRSFTIGKDWDSIKTSKRADGVCRIVNCPKLKTIEIGDYSFADYHSFELSSIPSLQSIDIGNNCFDFAPFILTGTIG